MPEFADKPGYAFAPGPPPEASRFLRNKGLVPSFSWQDVEPEEHGVAFTVAKAMQADVLQDIRDEVQKALDEGLTLAQFRKRLKPRLVEKGWWGKRDMVDPVTGETVGAQLGSPRRLKTIYRSNLRAARAAGQWERIQRTKAALPYLLYQTGPSQRHRPEHLAKRGLVLPADDPFWRQWYPPNGWGCKCWVRQLTLDEAESYGIGTAPKVEERPWTNPRTGETRMVPRGIDPAWTGNPGADRMRRMEEMLAGKLNSVDPSVAQAIARDIAASWRAERMMAGQATGSVPVGILSEELQDALGAETRVVQLGDQVAAKIRNKHADVETDVLLAFHEAIDRGPAAIEEVGGRQSLLFLVGGKKLRMLAIKHVPEAHELWISTIHSTTERRWRAKLRRDGVRLLRE